MIMKLDQKRKSTELTNMNYQTMIMIPLPQVGSIKKMTSVKTTMKQTRMITLIIPMLK